MVIVKYCNMIIMILIRDKITYVQVMIYKKYRNWLKYGHKYNKMINNYIYILIKKLIVKIKI